MLGHRRWTQSLAAWACLSLPPSSDHCGPFPLDLRELTDRLLAGRLASDGNDRKDDATAQKQLKVMYAAEAVGSSGMCGIIAWYTYHTTQPSYCHVFWNVN